MRKILVGFIMMSLLFVGCSSAATNEAQDQTTKQVDAARDSNNKTEDAKKEGEKKELSKDEALAVEYINTYLNGTDIEAKKKFVEDNVHPEIKSLFQLGQSTVSEESSMYKEPQVIESDDYESDGMKGTLVLIQGVVDGEKHEIIILVMEGKIGFEFKDSGVSEETKKNFDQLRSKFKTAPLK
ncbi:hypothetical protein [Paenibacillus aquistagni]|uniref:hypothetical protein n=1 Tax=Paenibacillus aquistagni TaxID=1852522 RepID=UPI00145B8FB8|nr:hypothetical protein [Paenibacillus aquistagni]NMM52167.1 hypothetical protein [Paenibacillus aquistagni]